MKLTDWTKTHTSHNGQVIHYQKDDPTYDTSLMICKDVETKTFYVSPDLHDAASWYNTDDVWDAIDYCQQICDTLNR